MLETIFPFTLNGVEFETLQQLSESHEFNKIAKIYLNDRLNKLWSHYESMDMPYELKSVTRRALQNVYTLLDISLQDKDDEVGTDGQSHSEQNQQSVESESKFNLQQQRSLGDDFIFIEDNEKTGAFYVCDHEVTQEEWKFVMGDNPSENKGDLRPVENIDWYNAVEYCNRRSIAEGLRPCYSGVGDDIECDFEADGYRLLTEAEWEYAARGGAKSVGYEYAGSNNIDEVAWYIKNNGDEQHHNVKTKKPNELGIYDMSGNVWEWCWDWYSDEPSKVKGYAGPAKGTERCLRGGSWYVNGWHCALSFRFYANVPHAHDGVCGLRVCCTAVK